jgi:hypothetical protein
MNPLWNTIVVCGREGGHNYCQWLNWCKNRNATCSIRGRQIRAVYRRRQHGNDGIILIDILAPF